MSRRKQARPRHVDDPDLDSPAIASNSVVPVFQEENGIVDEKTETLEDKDDLNNLTGTKIMDGLEDMTGSSLQENEDLEPLTDTPMSVESHQCKKCCIEFCDIKQYKLHRLECDEEPSETSQENVDDTRSSPMDLCKVNGLLGSRLSTDDKDVDNFDEKSDIRPDSDHQFDDVVNHGEDEVDAGGDEYDNQSDIDDIENEYDKPLDEGDDNDLDSIKEGDAEDTLKPETNPDLPAYVQTLSTLLSGVNANSNSNVMLEPLQATKAAVAQFAENNLPGKEQDVNKLQTTLYNLQQQQIMQLQLIHQLQLQLVAGGVQAGQLPAALLNGQLPLGPNFAGLNLTSALADLKSKAAQASKTSSRSVSPDLDMDSDMEEQHSPKNLEMKGSRPGTPHHSREKISTPTSEGTPDLMKPSPTLPMPLSLSMSSSDVKNNSSTTPTSLPSSILDFSRSSTMRSEPESPRFVNNDDPFFKHKCRICNKVFGSDSALQIHYRSHTGPPHKNNALFVDLSLKLGAVLSTSDVWTWEKPFQCNICGGRFSTRGNLKVHFQRHKAEFPNVEMNPNPVPEHLDKAPMPILGSPFPPSMGPFASPAFMGMQSLMNGFMFPPPHLAPRPPMSTPMMHQNNRHQEERRASRSPSRDKPMELKKEPSPIRPGSEVPPRRSPDVKDMKISPSHLPASIHMNMSKPNPVQTSIPLVSNYPAMSRLPSQPPYSQHHRAPVITPTTMAKNDQFRTTILPSSILDNDDNLEQFMEIDKSETSKLQQLVDNIEHKLTDPNQCVICHRVLSCKSALQMHYRIHTGERPFRCKICGRSFTTKGNLKTHMGVHRAKPPLRMMHQCPVCHKQFTNLLVLQQHIRSHTEMSGLPMHGMGGPMHHMFGPMGYDHPHGPLNMKRQFHDDYEKELDLSKKPRLSDSDDKMKLLNSSDEKAESVNDDDEEDFYQNEMDDEANKLAAEDAIKEGLARENSEERSSPDNSNDGDPNKLDHKDNVLQQPKNGLDFTSSIQRSSSPKYLQEDSNPSQDGAFNSYSTSLAALEERVRQIDSTMARNPLSQFHAAPFLLAPAYSGERALSPTSESDSEISKDRLKPATPALSTSSDGSMGGNFMIGAMDVRSSDVNGKTTMCNICYKTFACRSALDIHYRSHTKERPYKCDLCDKSFTTRGNMRQHLLTHKINEDGSERTDFESNNNNSCTPNQNDTDDDSEKSNDSSRFNESPSEKCKPDVSESQGPGKKEDISPCEKSNISSSSLTTSTPAPPRHSSSSYSSSENQSPFISKNPTVKHQCLVCQKGFSSASALQIHIRTHTGDKPFKCTVCGKAFTTKGNLKVHMGTHMWNNSPSRRGRRMSIEPPFMMAHKENPYLPHGFAPRPDFYPFQFPPFMNGLPGHHKSLSEMALMQNMSNGMGLKPDLTSPRSDLSRPKPESSPTRDDKPRFAESGELDLSMKSTNSSGSRSSEKTSPSSVDSNSSSGMVSPPHMSLGWGWKASCHFCSRTFPTTAALEHHVRSMHMMGDSLPKVGAS